MANAWTQVAGILAAQNYIHCLVEFKGKIYGGTGGTGKLFEWNGVNAWIDRATSVASHIYSLVVYNGKLYAGDDSGKLLRWNEVNAFIEEADIGTPDIVSFAELNGNLYFSVNEGTADGGHLYEWSGAGAPVIVAHQLNTQRYVHSIIVYNGKIYGGTGTGGRLFEWNGVNAWVQVAPQLEGQPGIRELVVCEGKLYGVTCGSGIEGLLFEWNGTNAWEKRANLLLGQTCIHSGVVHHENKILGGTEILANLFMWDGVADWLQVAAQFNPQQLGIFSLISYNGKVYGGTYGTPGGMLLEWTGAFPSPPTDLLCCDEASSIGPAGECVPAIIDTIAPYFSAIYNDPDVGDIADHYRIQVNTKYDLTGTVIWDSTKTSMSNVVEGNRCENLYYGGSILSVGVTYYWRIMFWDDEGHLGDWSEVNCFKIEAVIPDVKPPPYKLKVGKYILTCDADKQNVIECNFTLRQKGGCAEFDFTVGRPDYTINLGDEVLIYLYGQVLPWYRGRILERSREGSSTRVRRYAGYGHFEFLNAGALVPTTEVFAGSLLRAAIVQVLTAYVHPQTGGRPTITAGKIANPAYTIQQMTFDWVKPIDAMIDLCELIPGYEYGVDEAGDFYFRLESSADLEHKWVSKHIATYLPTEEMRKLVNRWYLEGGLLAAGTNYNAPPVENVASQGIYGIRSDKATIPSGMNAADIQSWGANLLANSEYPKVKAVITGIDIERTQTRIWPSGRMRVTGENGLPSPPDSFPIRTVTYHITPKGVTADIELGEKKASIKDSITTLSKQTKKEQEQLASDVLQLAVGSGIIALAIKDWHIDWGLAVNQVGADDIPIVDNLNYFAVDIVEDALEELAEGTAIQPDVINDLHIDWGLAGNEVGADDIPFDDPPGDYAVDIVEDALQELGHLTALTVSEVDQLENIGDVTTISAVQWAQLGGGQLGTISTANATIYVDKAAVGAGDGSTWADAYVTIQAAIDGLPATVAHDYTIRVRLGATPYRELVTITKHLITGTVTIEGEYYWPLGDCEANVGGAGEITDAGAFADVAVGDHVYLLDCTGANTRAIGSELCTVDNIVNIPNRIGTDGASVATVGWKYVIVRTEVSGSDDGTDPGTARDHCFEHIAIDNVYIRGLYMTFSDLAALEYTTSRNCYIHSCILEDTDRGIYSSSGSVVRGDGIYCKGDDSYLLHASTRSSLTILYLAFETGPLKYGSLASDLSVLIVGWGYVTDADIAFYAYNLSFCNVTYATIPVACNTGLRAQHNSVIRNAFLTNAAGIPVNPIGTVEGAYIM